MFIAVSKMRTIISREEKIKAIYEEIANKEWDIYCGIIEKYRLDWTEDRKIYIWDILSYISDIVWWAHTARYFELEETYEEMYRTDFMELIRVWSCYHQELEKQDDECVDYVYNIISKQTKNNL